MNGYHQTIPLDSLTSEAQIRTRNGFDEAGLQQLAESLKAQGMLQPIIVRQEHTKFVIVAGHRRRLAAMRAGFDSVPCIVMNDSDAGTVLSAQIAENLQRENLTLADTADAVRRLMDQHKNPAKVRAIVNKSAAWVSKHLTLTKPGFSEDVRALLETDATRDLDLLLTLDQIEKQTHPDAEKTARKMIAGVIDGTTTRANARAALDKMKAKPATKETASRNEGEGGDGGDDGEGDALKNATDALQRTFTMKLDVSAMLWLRRELAQTVGPCAHQKAMLAMLDGFAAECGLQPEPAKEE